MRSSDWSSDGCSSDLHGDVHDILHAVPRDVAHRALRIELDDKHHLLTRLGPVETELARFPRNIIPGVLVELRLERGATKRLHHRIAIVHAGLYRLDQGGVGDIALVVAHAGAAIGRASCWARVCLYV